MVAKLTDGELSTEAWALVNKANEVGLNPTELVLLNELQNLCEVRGNHSERDISGTERCGVCGYVP